MANHVMHKKLAKLVGDRSAIRKVDLSEVPGLKGIPEAVRECVNAEVVDVSFTDVTEVPDWVLQLPKLKQLNLLGCSSLREPPRNLHVAVGLEELSLQLGDGQQIPHEVFGMTRLKKLVLAGGISKLPAEIVNLKSLEGLELFLTQITTLPPSLGELPKLKQLTMFAMCSSLGVKSELDIASMVGTLAGCRNLEKLSLNDCGISSLPASIDQLEGLKILELASNLLVDYPPSLHNLANLVELDLGVNQLKRIHPGFGNLAKLKVLKLNSNWKNACDFAALFAEIEQLKELRSLQLWSCQSVTSLPESVASLTKLQEFDVDNNLLTDLPESLFTMSHLSKLRVSTNKLPASVTDRLVGSLPTTKVTV
jgi:Leucine-rich repeat (LRR) protein